MGQRLAVLREQYGELILNSFPGDEKESGGCLAAARGFFHINPYGGVEPCPFSPYSDTNIREMPLRRALESPLFQKLGELGMLLGNYRRLRLFGQKNRCAGWWNKEQTKP